MTIPENKNGIRKEVPKEMRDLLDEFQELNRATLVALRESAYCESPFPDLQFLTLPSFDDWTAWDVVGRYRSAPHFRLYRTTWKRKRDESVFASPVERLKHPRPFSPTIESIKLTFDVEAFGVLRQTLQSVVIPPFRESDRVQLDGVGYELAIRTGTHSARLRWSDALPEFWAELEAPVSTMLRLFENAAEARRTTRQAGAED